MNSTCSYSLLPGNSGSPVKSSAKMQPSDHMSTFSEYGILKMTSGAR